MRFLFFIILSFISVSLLQGQDKKAKKILDKLSDRYLALSSVAIDFDLIVKYPEEEATTFPSSVIQQNKMFVFKNSEQEYYGNGDDIWIYIADQNEVQINDFEEDEAEEYFITPLDLLNQYKSGKYAYHITDQKGDKVEIEFKPIDEFSDYSKFRITINSKFNKIEKIIGFGKDATRVTIQIRNVVENKKYPESVFQFDKNKYPGVRIEDLRLD